MKIKTIHKIDHYLGIPLCFILGNLSKIKRYILRQKIILPGNPRNILLIKTWGLGNLVLLLPVMRRLRQAYPGAILHFLSIEQNRDILQGDPYIDHSYFLNLENYRLFLKSLISVLYKLRKENIDLVVDFDQFSRIASLIAWFASAIRIGFDTKGQGRKFVYTHPVNYLNDKHMLLIFADLLRPLGLFDDGISPVAIEVKGRDKLAVERILETVGANVWHKPLIILHPGIGVNTPIRRWPIERFAQLADTLIEEFNAAVFFTGTKPEEPLINLARTNMNNNSFNLAGALNVRSLAWLVARSNLTIANDTALIHIASAMNAPVIGLYGPNTPFLYGPLNKKSRVVYKRLPCSPCISNFNAKQTFCRKAVCMNEITVSEVLEQARELLKTNA